jgi:hypothetical protein
MTNTKRINKMTFCTDPKTIINIDFSFLLHTTKIDVDVYTEKNEIKNMCSLNEVMYLKRK